MVPSAHPEERTMNDGDVQPSAWSISELHPCRGVFGRMNFSEMLVH